LAAAGVDLGADVSGTADALGSVTARVEGGGGVPTDAIKR
jgi:hypothetical protein